MKIRAASSDDKFVKRKRKNNVQFDYFPKVIDLNVTREVTSNQYYEIQRQCAGICIHTRKNDKYYVKLVVGSWFNEVNNILNLVK